ncbi:energy-coupling factor transporter transmembrane component T family protein [Pectinatus frisingensis]|uniref:energy-coupling factor transporter transmembrane component T family protein n=1 Tax=Pectinatus frisingensis TaxID=865 RepID=UPI0018C81C80|nr:energy-coupling factor transporter transmembrane component T [Pectinatus frisingensis]
MIQIKPSDDHSGKLLTNMPAWLGNNDDYQPVNDNENFLSKTILSVITKLTALRENSTAHTDVFFTASFKIFLTILLILFISLSHQLLFLSIVLSGFLIYLCSLTGCTILRILKSAAFAALFSLLIILPAALFERSSFFLLPFKVFLTTGAVTALALSTPFYSITKALGGLHIPGLFIMILDLTVKYIVLLGHTVQELLTALHLRSVGKNRQKYQSLGNILGMTFIKSQEYASATHDAMLCRCFTGEYHISQQHHMEIRYIVYVMIIIILSSIYFFTEGYL